MRTNRSSGPGECKFCFLPGLQEIPAEKVKKYFGLLFNLDNRKLVHPVHQPVTFDHVTFFFTTDAGN
jgi:hypothetical protein